MEHFLKCLKLIFNDKTTTTTGNDFSDIFLNDDYPYELDSDDADEFYASHSTADHVNQAPPPPSSSSPPPLHHTKALSLNKEKKTNAKAKKVAKLKRKSNGHLSDYEEANTDTDNSNQVGEIWIFQKPLTIRII